MSGETARTYRRLAAILAGDVVGFSALMGQDEEGTLARIKSLRRDVVAPKVEEYRGRVFKTTGDGFLAEFPSPVEAVRCAVGIHNALGPAGLQLRMGINLGDIIVEDDGDVYGDGVNVAARLEQLAEPGGLCISGKVYEEVRDKLALDFHASGEQQIKNIARPVPVYSLRPGPLAPAAPLPARRISEKPAIAVLPFTNLSGDPEQELFADGITEDILTELSRISAFLVIARNTTFTYKGRAADVKQVGRELGVKYVLEGSVRRAGNRIRVTAQLVEAKSGAHVWADRYDRDIADIFEVQDEITRSLVASTQTHVVIHEGAARSERPGISTWEFEKRGWSEMYKLSNESLNEALACGEAIRASDPASAKGHQLVAAACYLLVLMGFAEDREAMKERALHEAYRAIERDPRDEYSHWTLGMILGALYGRYDESAAAYRQALDLNPNFSLAYGSLGTMLAFAGALEESIANSQMCLRLNPRDPSNFFRYSSLALAHYLKADYAAAREWAERAVSRKPDWWLGHALVAAAKARMGDATGARFALENLLRLMPQARLDTLPFSPMRHAAHLEDVKEGLRQAGLA